MPAHPPSRAAAEARYSGLRLAALVRAAELFKPAVAPTPVRFATITAATLDAWREQWAGHPARSVVWRRNAMAADYRQHHPSRFDFAAWSGDTLSGLAIGRTGSAYCSIEYLEGSPVVGHPLKGQVIPAALTALLGYTKVLSRSEMRLVEPLAPLVPVYEARAFLLVEPRGEPPYCIRKIS